MRISRHPRRPDPLVLLIVFVLVGMLSTLTYQLLIEYGARSIPIATQSPPAVGVGG